MIGPGISPFASDLHATYLIGPDISPFPSDLPVLAQTATLFAYYYSTLATSTPFACFSPPLLHDSMGRKPWTTPDQADFLAGFIDKLEDEKNGNGLKAFYAYVAQEFIRQWPSPIPQDIDRNKITDPAELKAISDERRIVVSSFSLPLSLRTHSAIASKSKNGSRSGDVNLKTHLLTPSPSSTSLAKVPGNPTPCSRIKHIPLGTSNRRTRCCERKWTTCGNVANKRMFSNYYLRLWSVRRVETDACFFTTRSCDGSAQSFLKPRKRTFSIGLMKKLKDDGMQSSTLGGLCRMTRWTT